MLRRYELAALHSPFEASDTPATLYDIFQVRATHAQTEAHLL
jgi:hypothetical protein